MELKSMEGQQVQLPTHEGRLGDNDAQQLATLGYKPQLNVCTGMLAPRHDG